MEKQLLEALAKLLNIKPEEFEESLKLEDGKVREDLVSHVSGLFKDHIKTVRKSAKEEESKKSFKESREAFEKELTEKYEVENPEKLKGLELINLVIEAKKEVKEVKGKPVEITDDLIKKHPLFISMESDFEKYKGEEETRTEAVKTEVTKEFQKDLNFGKVKDLGLAKLNSLNPVLSPDAGKAAKQIDSLFYAELAKFDYDLQGEGDNKKVLVLKKDGTRLENDLGHAMEFDELVDRTAKSAFDFKAGKDIKMPGNTKDTPKGTPHIEMPKNDEEMTAYLRNRDIPFDQRQSVHDKFKELQTQN